MPSPIVDLHCHLLPGIDDGPGTMDESVAMARMASDNGITHAVVTPHLHPGRWENTLSSLLPVFAKFKLEVANAGIPLELGLACEARLDPELLSHLGKDELPFLGTLDDEKVMLLELPHGQIPVGADRFAAKLIDRGIRPVIAHPERNRQAMRNRDKLAVFEEMGCLFQLTAGSLLGKFGKSAEALARALLTSPSTFLIASDAHNTTIRVPELLSARDIAIDFIGEPAATALVSDNPWRVAAGHFQAEPKQAEPKQAKRKQTATDRSPGHGATRNSSQAKGALPHDASANSIAPIGSQPRGAPSNGAPSNGTASHRTPPSRARS